MTNSNTTQLPADLVNDIVHALHSAYRYGAGEWSELQEHVQKINVSP